MKTVLCRLLLLVAILTAAPVSAHQPVVVILANYLTLDDLLSAGPDVQSLAADGAIGLMNTGYRVNAPDVHYLMLATGIKAAGMNGLASFYDADELINGALAADVYHSQTGRIAPRGSAVCLGFARILRANGRPPFRMEAVGLLGTACHQAGLRTSVIGSRDADDENRRAGFIAMDGNGLVDSGDDAPQAGVGLQVIEPAEFNRLESMRKLLSKPAYDLQRAKALHVLDALVGRVRPMGGTIIVCSPCPIQVDRGFKPDLAPIILFRPHGGRGLLTSATTRTDGLISSMDVAPTILAQADLPVPDFITGRPAEVIASAKPIEHLRQMQQVVTQEYKIRIPVLVAIGVLAILAATLTETSAGRKRGVRKAIRPLLLFLLSLPAALLITDGFKIIGVGHYLASLALITAGIAAVVWGASWLAGKRISPLSILHGMTSVLILGDIFTGGHLLQSSMLTCNQICGMRYYGLGNEYMGMLVASALLFPLLVWKPRVMSIPVLIWFAVVTAAIGYPRLGADVGGFLTAVACFGVAWIALSGAKFRPRHAIALVLLAAVGVAVLSLLDTGARASHLGRTIAMSHSYGRQWLGYFITGKLMMHLGILKTPQVRYTILGSVPFFILYGRRMKSESAIERGPIQSAGWPAIIVGIIVAFMFNDSGVVPAGLMIAAYMVSMLYLRLSEAT